MANRPVKRFFHNIDSYLKVLKKQEVYERFMYNVLNRFQSHYSKIGKEETDLSKAAKDAPQLTAWPKLQNDRYNNSGCSKYSSDKDDFSNKWKLELDWLTKALEPALQLCRWALPAGDSHGSKPPPSSRSLTEIVSSIQRSKLGLQDWSLSDLTIGLYLIYLRQASTSPVEDFKGSQITSDVIDLIYHTELAKGAYKDSVAGLSRNSMLRESNVEKFVKNSSVLRPGYYIGVDIRRKLVILGIRGTHTVYDLITDIVSSSNEEVTFEGYSTHFGTAEAARWFLSHEMGTIKNCLDKHKGFRLRIVGHSLGGATASLLAIMLHKKSFKGLGFSPEIVSAVGYATPPCVSRELAESCSDYVTNVVMQDDIIPRLSVTSLTKLRNEILQTDWKSVFEREDWKSVVDLLTNAKQVISTVHDVARKVADYAKLRSQTKLSDSPVKKELPAVLSASPPLKPAGAHAAAATVKKDEAGCKSPEELFVPGTVYYLKRDVADQCEHKDGKRSELFTLWKRHPGEHFQRILLSGNLISDHKCDSHYYALRDVLKGLPVSSSCC